VDGFAATTTTPGSMIGAKNLTKYYGPFMALQDVTFSIAKGEVAVLLGPNGAGKTTVMRILTGYAAPTDGTARIHGFDVTGERAAAAACVGYLPENGPLYPDMTPFELLDFFGRARRMSTSSLREGIERVADRCQIGAILDKPIGRLSKGLRQRVGLAQALLHDPPVLILDEPTSGLDPNQTRDFREHIHELRADKTILVSTHLLHEVDAIADRALLIRDGELVFDGSPGELAAGESLEERFYRYTRGACESGRAAARPSPRKSAVRGNGRS
jgi:ABC-2 type transport system ATP-binding protein